LEGAGQRVVSQQALTHCFIHHPEEKNKKNRLIHPRPHSSPGPAIDKDPPSKAESDARILAPLELFFFLASVEGLTRFNKKNIHFWQPQPSRRLMRDSIHTNILVCILQPLSSSKNQAFAHTTPVIRHQGLPIDESPQFRT
jgi:hypothetical protein